ncbi:MAG: hypothetical protein AAGI69_18845 [Cyanobacteria bacterium P01_H01_bin.21]
MSMLLLKSLFSSGLASVALVLSATSALAADSIPARQLAGIAYGYAIANQPDRAIPLLEQAEAYQGGTCFEGNTWLKISVAYDAVNQSDKAQTYLDRAIDTADQRTEENCASSGTTPSESLQNRIIDYAEAGNLDLAVDLIQQSDVWSSPLTMAKIAAEYNKAGQSQQAQQLISDAIARVQDNESELAGIHINEILLSVAGLLISQDQADLANQVLEEGEITTSWLMSPTDALENDLETYRRMDLARLLMELDQPQQALAILDATVPTIQPSSQFLLEPFLNWIDAAQLYTQLGSEQADTLWQQIEHNLEQLSNSNNTDSVRSRLVKGYAEIGEFEQAKALAETIASTAERRMAYRFIAVAYAEAGLVNEANDLVASIGKPEFARRDILRTYLTTGQYAEAEQLAKQTVEFLPEVIRTYCETGQPERAVSLFEQLDAADDTSKDWLRSCIATQLAGQQQFDPALELTQTIIEPDHRARTLIEIAVQQINSTPSSMWDRLVGRLPNSVQSWFNASNSYQDSITILDQALEILQSET